MNPNRTIEMAQDILTNNNHIKRILYATDLTESAPRVYQNVLCLAQQFKSEIICLHVIDTFSQNSAMTLAMYYVSKDDKKKILNRERNRAIEEMIRRNRHAFIRQFLGLEHGLYPEQLGLRTENRVVFGNVEEQILLQSVSSNCDLIVMGAHEKPFLTFTTPLSKRVVKRSEVPVIVVPIPDKRKKRSTGFLPSFIHQFSAAGSK